MDQLLDVTGDETEDAVDTTAVPLVGRVGAGRSERAFCRVAHLGAAQQLLVLSAPPPASLYICPNLRAMLCGLTGYRHKCLFGEPDAPEWQAIRNTVNVLAQMAASE